MTTQKVEVGFDLTGTGGPFLTLDDPISGQLDNFDWVLGGTLFYDITSDVKAIGLNRGKNVDIGTFSAGEIVVELNNQNRTYDPTFVDSPFYGQIVPKREVRLSTNGIRQFSGVIDDWNLEYTVQGEATATFVASDGFVFFSNQTLFGGTAIPQTSGERIGAILDSPEVSWPETMRAIDTGVTTLGADVIQADTNVLNYLRLVEQSEFGRFFIAKNGDATFLDRTVAASSLDAVHLSDDGTGIGYNNLRIVYGSEQLANEVVVSSVITSGTATAIDTDSQAAYGIFNLTLTDLLMDSDSQVEDLAVFLASKYSQPEYRIDSVDVHVNDLSLPNQAAVLGLELGDVVKVTFTPSGIPPAIVKYAEIINIKHDTTLELQTLTLGLATLDYTSFVLDDETFGRLDADNGLGF
jgi:hypothetical protein